MNTVENAKYNLSDNCSLIIKFMDEVWGKANPDAIKKFVSRDFVDHAYSPGNASGHAAMVSLFNTAFSEVTHSIEDAVAQNNKVIIRVRVKGRHTGVFRGIQPTNNLINVLQYRHFTIKGGYLFEHGALFDTAALLTQIGGQVSIEHACNRK